MGLKVWNGEALCNISFARPNMNADAYLYCPGPSLADVEDGDIHVPGALSFALNTAYPKVRPDYWIGMDYPDCYDHALWGEGFRKVCRLGRENELVDGVPIKEFPDVYAATTVADVNMEYVFEHREANIPFAWFNHTFGVALHMMLWMGAKRIHFVGCDLGGSKDYYDDRELSPENRTINRRLYGKIGNGFISAFVRIGEQHGVECVSCTPGSPLNDKMRFVPLKHALAASMARAPRRGTKPVDCRDLAKDRLIKEWGEAKAPRGIVTACDRNFEWLLPLWLQNVRKWSTLPVAVVDIGLSQPAREWALDRGFLLHFDGPPLEPDSNKETFGVEFGWKPFAAIKSPFEETLFLDCDCEVVGPLDGAFDALDRADFAVAQDQMFHALDCAKNMLPDETMCNSGVFVCRRGSKAVELWAKACSSGKDGWRGNDQPMLSKVLHENPECATELDASYNVLAPFQGDWKARVDSITNSPKVLHRLTSHPQSKARLREIAESIYSVDGLWIQNADIMRRCEWVNSPVGERGVVIGVDENQEWMLPWWLMNYARFNSDPVMVADFGLTDAGKDWCKKHGLFVSPRIELDGKGWFKKPLGCLHTIWRKTVWLDTDVQVKKNIGPLFEYDGIAATIDRGTPQKWKDALPGGATIYNTGCVAYEWGEPIIQKWAQIVMLMKDLKAAEGRLLIPTGDQECFAMAVRKYGRVIEMPPHHHALRLGDDPENSILKHWTGPEGKSEIKKQMGIALPPNRKTMLQHLPHGGIIAEIGVRNGEFSKEICEVCAPKELHLIDPWRHFEQGYDDINNVSQGEQDQRYANARLITMDYECARFHRLTSEDAATRFEDGKFDWIYIDGNHAYEFVKRDLEMYAPKIKKGGFLCGHDFCDRPEAQGVMKAVNEFCAKGEWELKMVTTDVWPSFALQRKGE